MRNTLILFLAIVLPVVAVARAVRVPDMKTRIAESQLVFIGQVQAIEPTGIPVSLSYPTLRHVAFTWLNMKMKVIEPIKGVRKGETIQTAILAVDNDKSRRDILVNGPGMLAPRTNFFYLLCLLPTTRTNLYAALTAPYDDSISIMFRERPDGADELRKEYEAEIRMAPKTNAIIHLESETSTSPSGWQWDAPKGQTADGKPSGPITFP